MPLSEHKPRKGPSLNSSKDPCFQLYSALSKPGVYHDAHTSKVVWARVKGYPWWPAQVLSKAAAKQHLGNVTHKSKTDAPVIFFGTSEIAWIGGKDVASWEEGMQQSFQSKGRKNKKFVVALEQVRDFLTLHGERKTPAGWWCAPPVCNASPVPDEPVSSEGEDEHQQEAQCVLQLQAQLQHQQAAGGSYPHGSQAAVGLAAVAAAAAISEDPLTCEATVDADGDEEYMDKDLPNRWDRQQLWDGATGPSKEHVAQQRQSRRRRNSHNADSGCASDSDSAAAGSNERCNKRHYSSFMQQRQRQLLRQEGKDATASESDGTDTDSVAMAAMAIAELAHCSSWDACRGGSKLQHQQHGKPNTASAELTHAEAVVHSSQPPSAHAVKMELDIHAAALEVITKQYTTEQDNVQVAAAVDYSAQAVVGTDDSSTLQWGLPPRASRPQHAGCEALGSLLAAADLQQQRHSCLVATADAVVTAAAALASVTVPAAGYSHGGLGLPCSSSWQYTVCVPSTASAATTVTTVAAVNSSGTTSGTTTSPVMEAITVDCLQDEAPQQPEQGEAQQQQQHETQQLDQPMQALCGIQPPQQQPDQQLAFACLASVPAVSVCPATAYYRHVFSGANREPAEADNDAGSASGCGGATTSVVVAEPEESAAVSSDFPVGSKWARTVSLPACIAAANAAILAAFTPSAAVTPSCAAVGSGAGGSNGSSSTAYTSNGSGGSTQQRGVHWARRRNNTSATSVAATAAAAAAAAAAHMLTPPNPQLDALNAHLLQLGPVLPEQQLGQLDSGFTLPREVLLNRPPKFEWLKRNLFVSKERPKRLPKDEVSVCNCRVEPVVLPDGTEHLVGCGEHCLNRLSYIHCDPRTCPCSVYCQNKPFHLLKAPQLDVFLTESCGHGVRVTAPLPKGQFVVEYAGEVIDQGELSCRMDAARESGQQHFYIMEMGPGLFIDALKKGNHARLLNSCCDPNCETQKWRDAATGEVRIGIFTRKDVAPGEELTYDYMFEHYGLSSGLVQGFKCQCGAKNCRGTMDVNPERKRDWGRRLEVFWEGDGVFYRGTITGYSASSGKHTIMYDDGDTERVRLDMVPHRWLDGDASPRVSAQAPSGSPFGEHKGPRVSPPGVEQPTKAAAADSGSWSQTENEPTVAAEDGSSSDMVGAPAAAAATAASPLVGPRALLGKPTRVLGPSPLGPGATVAAAAAPGLSKLAAADADTVCRAGVKRPLAVTHDVEVDDAVAADALVRLGIAAEVALESEKQLEQPPSAKKRRLSNGGDQQMLLEQQRRHGAHVPHGMPADMRFSSWHNSSSISSQSAYKVGHGAQPVGRRASKGLDALAGEDEYLPWEQLISGIQAIKRQGPALFQPADGSRTSVAFGSDRSDRSRSGGSSGSGSSEHLGAVTGRFGQLLQLVGRMEPAIQQKQQHIDLLQLAGVGIDGSLVGRSGSWGSSSSTNTTACCPLPLFRGSSGSSSSIGNLGNDARQQLHRQLGMASFLVSAGSTSSSWTQQQLSYQQAQHQQRQQQQLLQRRQHQLLQQQQQHAPEHTDRVRHPLAAAAEQALQAAANPGHSSRVLGAIWAQQHSNSPRTNTTATGAAARPPSALLPNSYHAPAGGAHGSSKLHGSWQQQLGYTTGSMASPIAMAGQVLQQRQQQVLQPTNRQQPLPGVPIDMHGVLHADLQGTQLHQQQQQHSAVKQLHPVLCGECHSEPAGSSFGRRDSNVSSASQAHVPSAPGGCAVLFGVPASQQISQQRRQHPYQQQQLHHHQQQRRRQQEILRGQQQLQAAGAVQGTQQQHVCHETPSARPISHAAVSGGSMQPPAAPNWASHSNNSSAMPVQLPPSHSMSSAQLPSSGHTGASAPVTTAAPGQHVHDIRLASALHLGHAATAAYSGMPHQVQLASLAGAGGAASLVNLRHLQAVAQ